MSEDVKLVQHIAEKLDNLPSLPGVGFQVMELAMEDSASAEAIASVVEKDPALTVRVLKMAKYSFVKSQAVPCYS